MDKSNSKIQFEEYKLLRDTAIHFDKILLDIRKITIFLAFIIFGLIAEALRINSVKFVDLAITLVLIELLMVMIFFYLEKHYRTYLVKISDIAVHYEKELDFGIKFDDCDDRKVGICDDKKVGISKCLKCVHDQGMGIFIRIAHLNVYTSLLTLGFLTFNVLMGIKIELSFEEILIYSIVMGLIVFLSFIIFALRNIKKQTEEDKFYDDFPVYLISIMLFVALTYLIYYWRFPDISIANIKFLCSFVVALIISVFFFFIYGVFNKKINEKMWEILAYIGITSKKK